MARGVVQVTLLCHDRTAAQRLGRWPLPDDALLAPTCEPGALRARLSGQASVQLPAWLPAAGQRCLSAPEHRAVQTAERLQLEAEVQPALADCDLGRWQGRLFKDIQHEEPDALQQWLSDPTCVVHGGESLHAVHLRVRDWLEGLPAGRWLAVTHPWVIRLLMRQVLDLPWPAVQRLDVLPLSTLCLSRHEHWRLQLQA